RQHKTDAERARSRHDRPGSSKELVRYRIFAFFHCFSSPSPDGALSPGPAVHPLLWPYDRYFTTSLRRPNRPQLPPRLAHFRSPRSSTILSLIALFDVALQWVAYKKNEGNGVARRRRPDSFFVFAPVA